MLNTLLRVWTAKLFSMSGLLKLNLLNMINHNLRTKMSLHISMLLLLLVVEITTTGLRKVLIDGKAMTITTTMRIIISSGNRRAAIGTVITIKDSSSSKWREGSQRLVVNTRSIDKSDDEKVNYILSAKKKKLQTIYSIL